MGAVRGCNLPDDLMYNVDSNVWGRKRMATSLSV